MSLEFPALDVAGRADRLRDRFDAAEVDALLCTDLLSVRYLTGFTGSNAVLLVATDRLVLVTDGRYTTQAGDQLADAGVDADVEITREPWDVLAPLVSAVDRLGLEADDVSWSTQRRLVDAFRPELVPTSGLVLDLRTVKDEGEVARLEHAADIADAALARVAPMLTEGPTERQVRLALETAMIDGGADGPSFETIVASGPNGAKPHARPTDRPIGDGDLVVIDFGALYDGYHSDMTRTLPVGEISATQQRMLDVVTEAQAAGVALAGPGVAGVDVDAACRAVIGDAGWGDAFVHGTGHGIGLEIHELPRASLTSDDVLAVGHCVTVEPGVYLPDHGGVRVEDSLVITADGCRALTKAPKAS